MQGSFYTAAIVSAALCAGCAGNGEGLDANGQPVGAGASSDAPITADFQSIQDHVFTPICAKCHVGAGAPEGLQLDAGHSYNLTVGVPSAERPDLVRIKPSDPDDSYLVQKIEGAPGILGGQMPLGETPLAQASIDAIRQWITNGAPNAPAAATAEDFAVQTTAPLDGAALTIAPKTIVVTFSQELDPSLVNETTIQVENLSAAHENLSAPLENLSTPLNNPSASRHLVSAAAGVSAMNRAVLLLKPLEPLTPGDYKVTLRGTGAAALATMKATPLGSDTTFHFTVESMP